VLCSSSHTMAIDRMPMHPPTAPSSGFSDTTPRKTSTHKHKHARATGAAANMRTGHSASKLNEFEHALHLPPFVSTHAADRPPIAPLAGLSASLFRCLSCHQLLLGEHYVCKLCRVRS
jgi:hypothetical protein